MMKTTIILLNCYKSGFNQYNWWNTQMEYIKKSVNSFNLDSIYNKKILSNDIISIIYQDNSQYIGIYDTNQNPAGMGKLIYHNQLWLDDIHRKSI